MFPLFYLSYTFKWWEVMLKRVFQTWYRDRPRILIYSDALVRDDQLHTGDFLGLSIPPKLAKDLIRYNGF
jgi:hypothetical protein